MGHFPINRSIRYLTLVLLCLSLATSTLAHGRGFIIPQAWAGPDEYTLYAIHVTAEKSGIVSFRLVVPEGFRIKMDDVIRKWDCECFIDEQGFVKSLSYKISIPKGEHVEFHIFTAKNPAEPGKYKWLLIVTYADGSKDILEQDLWIAGVGNNTHMQIDTILLLLFLVCVISVVVFIVGRRRRKNV